jgi:hypothetical protein
VSTVTDILGVIYPDFGKARRERRKIRRKCRDNLAEIGRSHELYRIDMDGRRLEFLNETAEEFAVEADSLIKTKGSPVGRGAYKINPSNHSDIERELNGCISEINTQNRWSLGAQIALIVFVVGTLAIAIFLGIVGIGTVATEVGKLLSIGLW